MTKPTHFIAIDLHENVLQACVLDERGEISEEFRLRLVSSVDGQEALRRLSRWRIYGTW